jgi:Protein of unknown function (DUF2550)
VGGLIAPLEVLGGLLLLFGLVIGGFVARRHLLARGGATFDCSLRRDSTRKPGGWMLGVARYEDDRLEWFRIFTFDPRPWKVLKRARIGLLEWRPPAGGEIDSIMPDSVVVRCSYGPDEVLEMAMTESAYTGFSTWLESAPPGIAPFTS